MFFAVDSSVLSLVKTAGLNLAWSGADCYFSPQFHWQHATTIRFNWNNRRRKNICLFIWFVQGSHPSLKSRCHFNNYVIQYWMSLTVKTTKISMPPTVCKVEWSYLHELNANKIISWLSPFYLCICAEAHVLQVNPSKASTIRFSSALGQ